MRSMLDTDLVFNIILYKDEYYYEGNDLTENKNFLIFDDQLFNSKWLDKEEDSFFIISDDDDFIIKKNEKIKRPVKSTLAVLYRCNGQNCTIRKENKFKTYSYFFSLGYRGFFLQHQVLKNLWSNYQKKLFGFKIFLFLRIRIFFLPIGN